MSQTFDSEQFLKTASTRAGVYQMFDANANILYVGKAKNLKKRLTSYFRKSGLTIKTQALVDKIAAIQLTITESESAALVLEQNLIKSLKPTYNILLKDDKSIMRSCGRAEKDHSSKGMPAVASTEAPFNVQASTDSIAVTKLARRSEPKPRHSARVCSE